MKSFNQNIIKHKSEAITFVSGGLNAAQVLMGHYRATTTDIYTRSTGLYTSHQVILDALGGSGIGQAVSGLLEKQMPQELVTPEAFCSQNHVANMVQ